jgi:hypothetical protein
MKKRKNLVWIFFVGLILLAGAFGVKFLNAPPDQTYLNQAPPPGENAKPDPPNPDKVKKLSPAAAP